MTQTPYRPDPHRTLWNTLFLASGAVALSYEVVWMRRLGVLLGGSAAAAAVTVGAFMAGLGLGGALARRLRGPRGSTYAALEASAAAWAVVFPWLLDLVRPWLEAHPDARTPVAILLLALPATALGATWPLLASSLPPARAAALYAFNTLGAVFGVLGSAFVLLPAWGVRTTELLAAAGGFAIAGLAWRMLPTTPARQAHAPALAPATVLIAAGAAGLSAMGLEVLWFRLSAVALGSTVQVHALVLAVFLATLAVGAALGRRWPADPRTGLVGGLTALGVLAGVGAMMWGGLPYAYAALYRWGGPDLLLPGSALLAALAMGGAPAASGLTFTNATRALGDQLQTHASSLYAANTLGSILGAWCVGLWLLPAWEIRASVACLALVAGLAGSLVSRTPWPAAAVGLTCLAIPAWDARLYAVGVHLRISDFADPSHEAVERFVDEGWELLSYDHGPTGAVAVGRSTRTGQVWMSINGKVDASTGLDMATQRLSGELPLRMAAQRDEVLLVGLASGVTAGSILAFDDVAHMTVVELEPAVVEASHHFDHVNGRPLEDPRTTLVVDDARAVLQREGPAFDVIVSEPSNPWITGVSNLFTEEYWQTARRRLAPGGVMCQWVQLYGMGPDELRALVRTFRSVFPEVWLFETVPGADALLIGGEDLSLDDLPLAPTLDPAGVARLAGEGWLNTDDHPRVEWRAPGWLHYATAARNAELIEAAAEP